MDIAKSSVIQMGETFALFIDVANTYRHLDYPWLLNELAIRGRIEEKNAFADFASPSLAEIQRVFLACGVRMVQVPRVYNGRVHKALDDVYLAKEARDCLEKFPKVNTYVLASGDGDFVPLVKSLHDHRKRVIVVSSKESLSSLLRYSLLACFRHPKCK